MAVYWKCCLHRLTNGTVLHLGRIDLRERQFWSPGVHTKWSKTSHFGTWNRSYLWHHNNEWKGTKEMKCLCMACWRTGLHVQLIPTAVLRMALVAGDPAWDAMACAWYKSFFTTSTSLFCPVVRKWVHVSQISSLNSLWKRNDLLSLPPSFLSLQRLKLFCTFPFWGEPFFVHLNSQARVSVRADRFTSRRSGSVSRAMSSTGHL